MEGGITRAGAAGMSVAQLKACLERRKIDYSACIEKRELVDLLCAPDDAAWAALEDSDLDVEVVETRTAGDRVDRARAEAEANDDVIDLAADDEEEAYAKSAFKKGDTVWVRSDSGAFGPDYAEENPDEESEGALLRLNIDKYKPDDLVWTVKYKGKEGKEGEVHATAEMYFTTEPTLPRAQAPSPSPSP
mmetsp:Transcript_3191/g.9760  ORF Transcript_3191/g.9760 Transcript_3191/m.9760 type:complete len:190 (+) Transcript_3191:438-1007(+)